MDQNIRLLREAAYEIKQLRAQNNLMAARLDMFDSMMSLFVTIPFREQRGMSVDLVYEIEKHIQSQSE